MKIKLMANSYQEEGVEESDSSSFISKTVYQQTHWKVFLDEEIGPPVKYRDLIRVLSEASAEDKIDIYISSPGGDLNSAEAIIQAIALCEAHVKGILTGMAHSAASMIALSCDSLQIWKSATMMIHTVYSSQEGIVSNTLAQSLFNKKCVEELLEEVYSGFLTHEELERVKAGSEIWLNANDIFERYNLKNVNGECDEEVS